MNQKVILVLFAMVIGMTMLFGVVGAMCEKEVDKEWEREKLCLESGGKWVNSWGMAGKECRR